MKSASPLIRIHRLTRQFGKVLAVNGLDFEVFEGEWVAIMGPSGSGKTTLMNLIALLDKPSSGEYYLNGEDTRRLTENELNALRRETIGLVFQQFHLVAHLTALENVMLAQYFHSLTDRAEAVAALERVGLGHRLEHLPAQLSGGEKQRVCIARALINDPSLILADEPTGNLDEENEGRIIEVLKSLHEEGRTILLITHNPQLGGFADRILRLNHGRIDAKEDSS